MPDDRISSISIIGDDEYSTYTDTYSWDQSGKIAYIDRLWESGSAGRPTMKAFDDEGRLIEEADDAYQCFYIYSDSEKRNALLDFS